MDLSFAFLANTADHLTDGRLLIIGPDFDIVGCPTFPATVPFAVVVKMSVEPHEVAKLHTIRVECQFPNGKREALGPESEIQTKPNQFDPAKNSGASVIVNAGIMIQSAGEHFIHVIIDGLEVKCLPITVVNQDALPEMMAAMR